MRTSILDRNYSRSQTENVNLSNVRRSNVEYINRLPPSKTKIDLFKYTSKNLNSLDDTEKNKKQEPMKTSMVMRRSMAQMVRPSQQNNAFTSRGRNSSAMTQSEFFPPKARLVDESRNSGLRKSIVEYRPDLLRIVKTRSRTELGTTRQVEYRTEKLEKRPTIKRKHRL